MRFAGVEDLALLRWAAENDRIILYSRYQNHVIRFRDADYCNMVNRCLRVIGRIASERTKLVRNIEDLELVKASHSQACRFRIEYSVVGLDVSRFIN